MQKRIPSIKQTLVIVPARLGSTRLANKPLAMIGDKTMIEHVALNIQKIGIDYLYVAVDNVEISNKLEKIGIKTIMTDSNIASGTDRVYSAWKKILDHEKFQYIVNIQGDMPFINPSTINNFLSTLWNTKADIVTAAVQVDYGVAKEPSNVKLVVDNRNYAMYFSRAQIPYSADSFLYHLGIYGFNATSLEKFVHLGQSTLEIQEKLEQLRALENGMSIEVCMADEIPISVDTKDDLEKARNHYEAYFKSNGPRII